MYNKLEEAVAGHTEAIELLKVETSPELRMEYVLHLAE